MRSDTQSDALRWCMQVASVAKRLASGRIYHHDEEMGPSEGGEADPTPTAGGPSGRILVMSLLDGSKNRRQRVWVLAEPPQLVIGNPAALCNLVTSGRLRYHNVKMVVLDEVDAILLHRDTRAELHNLLAKYLSPSYLNADIEDAQEGGGAGEEAQMLVAAGLMKKGEEGMAGAAGEQLTPHKLTRRQTIFCSATIPQHNHFLKQVRETRGWTSTRDLWIPTPISGTILRIAEERVSSG
jgi:superfamily II DNA/RNA helicase